MAQLEERTHPDPAAYMPIGRLKGGTTFTPEDDAYRIYGQPGKHVIYRVVTDQYWGRKLTYQSDALNAFAGILARLTQEIYPRGFFGGLPIQDMGRSLVWEDGQDTHRRSDFPKLVMAGGGSWARVDTSRG